MKFHSNDTSLRNMTHTTSIPNQNFFNFVLIFCWKSWFHVFLLIVSWHWPWNFIQMIPPWEIWHITHLFQIKFSKFCAYFWLKLLWNFIKKIPPSEIRHITLLFQIKSFQFCAYFWLKLVWNFIQRIPPWDIWRVTLQFKIIISWVFPYF